MNELDSLLRAAGRMMLDYQSPKVFSKGHHADFVTEADIAVQSYLVDALQRAYPHAKFLAEEEERHVLTDALTFIIDPIDGTTNYFRRRRCSMISIGAVENKLPVFGGLYDPYTDEMYLAERGKGATCNGERIRVSSRRGTVETRARVSGKTNPGETWMPFHFQDGNANWLTNAALDNISATPEYKVCAVRVEKA